MSLSRTALPTLSPAPPGTSPAGAPARRRRDMVAVNIGNAIEWFDWNIYAIFAPFFAAQFFNNRDPLSALLATLAVFGVGFLMRPIGGWLFGKIADVRGRRFSLTLAILLAAVGSLIIAVSPTFAQVGVVASAILLCARLLQGLSHGGETGSAFTYLAEVAPAGKRGLWASTPWLGVAAGTMAATGLGVLLTTLFSDEQMASFGWRVPFVVGALLGRYGLLIRFRMAESHVFERSAEAAAADDVVVVARPSVWRTLWSEKRAVLHISALSMSGVVVFYTWFIFAPSYAVAVHEMDAQHSLIAGLLAQGVFLAMIPVMGRLADRWGRKPLLFVFTLGFAVLAFPLQWLLGSGPVSLFAAMGVASVLLAAACAPLGTTFTELVPTRVRATVVGFTYGGASAVFGGSAPYLNTWLSSQGMHAVFVAALIAACLVTAVVTLRMPETRTVELT